MLNADDPTCVELASRTRAQVFWFAVSEPSATKLSSKNEITLGAFVDDNGIIFRDSQGQREVMPVSEIPLKGSHNVENALAAVCVGAVMGCDTERIRTAVRNFKAVEHRLEYVATICGVEYYNDSKATNVDATIKALESFPANVHLILGGKDKDSDYTLLNELLRERVKRVYTIGAAAEKIESQIKDAAEIDHAETLENAVNHAAATAEAADVVLLAPACASFDQFQNYEHRGRVFKELIGALVAQSRKF